jgi:PAS domain S-box-containing protein
VLVIDDAESIHQDFRKILGDRGPDLCQDAAELFGIARKAESRGAFEVDFAYGGEEGLRLVQQAKSQGRPYAIAFVDMRMPPGWDGLETSTRLWKADSDIQIVLCTAYSDYSWEEVADRLGKQTDSLLILKKPFDNVEVLQSTHALTKKWSLTQQAKSRLEDLDRLVNERTRELRASNEKLEGEITERARTEEALRAAQARLNYLVTQSPTVIYSLKINSKQIQAVWASDSAVQMTGYTAAEVCQPDWWPSHVHPGDWEDVLSARTRILAVDRAAAEYRLRHKDGQYRWVRDEQRLVRRGPEPVEIVGTLMDITERKELEERLRQSQKMEAIGLLAGGIAHDFNNLLLVMRGHAELLLLRHSEHTPETTESLRQITTASERAANLTRQLLAFSRKQLIQPKPLLLNDVVANMTKLLQRLIGDHIQLQCDFAARMALVQADPGMLEEMLVNLVVNAREAMPDGGRLVITTEEVTFDEAYARVNQEASPGKFACLTVSDTGAGIAPEHLPHLFEPFFTTKEVGKGPGLGLATVYGIVKQHRGWIDVSSQPRSGATFKIFLPALADDAECGQMPIEKDLRGGDETILLVEDDEAVRSLTRRLLENFGYRVREAATGREALAQWSGHSAEFALLLTDIVMPQGISGVDLAGQLRAQYPALKVVFMSGYPADAADKNPGQIHRPRTRFVQKPCPWRDLLSAVRGCLDEAEPGNLRSIPSPAHSARL